MFLVLYRNLYNRLVPSRVVINLSCLLVVSRRILLLLVVSRVLRVTLFLVRNRVRLMIALLLFRFLVVRLFWPNRAIRTLKKELLLFLLVRVPIIRVGRRNGRLNVLLTSRNVKCGVPTKMTRRTTLC